MLGNVLGLLGMLRNVLGMLCNILGMLGNVLDLPHRRNPPPPHLLPYKLWSQRSSVPPSFDVGVLGPCEKACRGRCKACLGHCKAYKAWWYITPLASQLIRQQVGGFFFNVGLLEPCEKACQGGQGRYQAYLGRCKACRWGRGRCQACLGIAKQAYIA